MKKQFLEIGKFVKSHGLNGELHMLYWCDGFHILSELEYLYLDKGNLKLRIENCRAHKTIAIIKLDGINNIDDARKLLNKVIYMDRNDIELEDGVYFHQDLIGLNVIDAQSSVNYGLISEIHQTGANDVYEIKGEKRSLLFPAIPQVIKEVNIDGGYIKIIPIKGLFEFDEKESMDKNEN